MEQTFRNIAYLVNGTILRVLEFLEVVRYYLFIGCPHTSEFKKRNSGK